MKDFRQNVKMCAEGGHIDVAADKKLIKRAFKMHDNQRHEGKPTDLSKLKRGGLAKRK